MDHRRVANSINHDRPQPTTCVNHLIGGWTRTTSGDGR
jgi:hypothetical protein